MSIVKVNPITVAQLDTMPVSTETLSVQATHDMKNFSGSCEKVRYIES